MTQTNLERIMAQAVDGAARQLREDPIAAADLAQLLKAGQRPWIIRPGAGHEIFLEFRPAET